MLPDTIPMIEAIMASISMCFSEIQILPMKARNNPHSACSSSCCRLLLVSLLLLLLRMCATIATALICSAILRHKLNSICLAFADIGLELHLPEAIESGTHSPAKIALAKNTVFVMVFRCYSVLQEAWANAPPGQSPQPQPHAICPTTITTITTTQASVAVARWSTSADTHIRQNRIRATTEKSKKNIYKKPRRIHLLGTKTVAAVSL